MRLTLVVDLTQPAPAGDIDDLIDLLREAIEEKLGEIDYLRDDIENLYIDFQYL